MNLFVMLGYIVAINWFCLTVVWLVSVKIRDASIIDIYWGIGFIVMAWACLLINLVHNPTSVSISQWLINFMVTIWGFRLSLHLAIRNLGKGEDYRYVAMRKRSVLDFRIFSYFRIFMFQGLLQIIVITPILAMHYYPQELGLGFFNYLGLALWGIGFAYEILADVQLVNFRSNPINQNAVLNSGLWSYSRHPNYFGDALQWWAFFIFSLQTGHYWGIIGPILMMFIFLRLTIKLLEFPQTKKRPDYEEYVSTTNVFFPGPKKNQ